MPKHRLQSLSRRAQGPVVVMGRHRAMSAATPDLVTETVGAVHHAAPAVRRRLGPRTVPDVDRWQRLRAFGINRPAGPLRDAAIEAAALVWAHTPPRTERGDETAVRHLAACLYDEAVLYGVVDEERALTREKVDAWLGGQCPGSMWSRRTYRTDLYAAGRVLYPREYPAVQAPLAPRPSPVAPATTTAVAELYAATTHLPEAHRKQAVTILDMVTGAGLTSPQVKALCGSHVQGVGTPAGHVAVIAVPYRGQIIRRTPVLCTVRSGRLLERAERVGEGRLLPGASDSNAVNRVNGMLSQRGLPTIDVPALRHGWLLDLATHPHLTMTGFLAITGTTGVRAMGDLSEHVPVVDIDDLAARLMAEGPR
ncbi:hypothetical protein M3G47_08475 [Corynebacterium sanguinis]|uniref:hypothetical protein n=1 Tax=Corynebacterium sanguinis TaxID=2594913 RepID=UPI0021A3772E|nr:hypothetical protein [Corynebacterium sanguinis]MCT1493035.1 hypothetical protein [Corynebacterium sanguinis]MCT2248109.1 hypothetical protein [Corynebacterium sanguinis]